MPSDEKPYSQSQGCKRMANDTHGRSTQAEPQVLCAVATKQILPAMRCSHRTPISIQRIRRHVESGAKLASEIRG
jgi:hypothetical protein